MCWSIKETPNKWWNSQFVVLIACNQFSKNHLLTSREIVDRWTTFIKLSDLFTNLFFPINYLVYVMTLIFSGFSIILIIWHKYYLFVSIWHHLYFILNSFIGLNKYTTKKKYVLEFKILLQLFAIVNEENVRRCVQHQLYSFV